MKLVTLPGVFRPLPESRLLAEVVAGQPLAPGSNVLDLCTGSGIVAITAARRLGARVTAVDVSRRALATTRLNARREGVDVRVLRSDLFGAVPGERFDLVCANPPYLPAEADGLPPRGPSRAWEGGRDGRALLDRILADVPAHLVPGGSLVVLHSRVCGVERTLAALRERGLETSILARRREPFGPLLRARAEDLERRGLIAPGQAHDELVVVRGRAPATARRAPARIVGARPAVSGAA